MKILQRNLKINWTMRNSQSGHFQQDGATSPTTLASMAEIQSFFGDRVISKGLRPPRSPDLTPPDYFLWEYLKGTVYQTKPNHET